MAPRPDLVDNLDLSHADALSFLGSDPGTAGRPVSVATGYVNLGGLHHLATVVAGAGEIRVLLGAVPDAALGERLPLDRFRMTIAALREDRDLSRFPPSRAATRLADIATWLERDDVLVRRYVARFLHGKAYLYGSAEDGRAALITSANLTNAGLHHNLELGLVGYDPAPAGRAIQWFDRLWSEASDFKEELRALLFPDATLIDPRSIYLRALLELYGPDEAEGIPDAARLAAVDLARFQRDGFERARRIVERHHGVIYADGVGTGKTEIGLAFIEEYAVHRGHHALVVAPAQLASEWRRRIDHARLPAQVVTFNELALDEQLAGHDGRRRRVLNNRIDTYRLVVVDEAHALRNPDTRWYQAMERLLGGSTDVVLLSATPINNGLWDLYHMVMLFAHHDRAFAHVRIPSVRQLFLNAGANERDPENLDPQRLFTLADQVSVRRDRQFIEANYPGATFSDGTPVRFPQPQPQTERYDIDAAHPNLVHDVVGAIRDLSMARYRPSAFRVGGEETQPERALSGLLQSGLLKRFESCWWACLQSVERMIRAHELLLAAWERGVVPAREGLRQAAREEADDSGAAAALLDDLISDGAGERVSAFRPEYREAIASDRDLLRQMATTLSALSPAVDPKLAALRRVLTALPAQKVAIFATFADTVRYIDSHLARADAGDRERVVVIGPETDPDQRTAALARFCPNTVVEPGYVPVDGEVDMLISTDVLSEGQNLQQAAAVISYDMPWNPQRVVQRNGRVMRLKSPHTTVRLVTLMPVEGELEQFLRLEVTIRRKVLAASVYGLETQVIEGMETELRTFAHALAAGDLDVVAPATDEGVAMTGEVLRGVLQRAAAEGEIRRLQDLPWGVGSVFRQGPGVPSVGPPGVFLACRTTPTKGNVRYWRYVAADGLVIGDDADILRRIDPGSAVTEEVSVDLEAAWQAAVADIVAEHNRRADPRAVATQPGPAQQFALDILRDPAVALPEGADDADEALTVERSSAVRHALGTIRSDLESERISRNEAAVRIVEVVREFGLQPVPAPDLLPEITEDDVGVVCWMGVLAPAS